MHFTFVDTMDQVVQASLLDEPPLEESAKQNGEDEQSQPALPEPRPLHMDERHPLTRDQLGRSAGILDMNTDEQHDNNGNEYEPGPLLIIPDDHNTLDSYPQMRAQDSDH